MENLIKKKIAVIGVSADDRKFGCRIFKDMVAAGYDVYGVNMRGGTVAGRTIYRAIKDIGAVPDLVITVVMPQVTETIVEQCRELGVKEIWMQPGSSSPEAVAKAQGYGMTVIWDACFMVQQGIW